MRFSYRCLIVLLALVLCLQSATAAPHAAVRRQDELPAEAPASPDPTQGTASQQPSATPSQVPSSRIESNAPSSTSSSSVKPSETPSAAATSNAPSTAASGVPSPTSSACELPHPLQLRRQNTDQETQLRALPTHCQLYPLLPPQWASLACYCYLAA